MCRLFFLPFFFSFYVCDSHSPDCAREVMKTRSPSAGWSCTLLGTCAYRSLRLSYETKINLCWIFWIAFDLQLTTVQNNCEYIQCFGNDVLVLFNASIAHIPVEHLELPKNAQEQWNPSSLGL